MFHPNIFVRETNCPAVLRLIVKIEMEKTHLDETARQLRQYMRGESCRRGLIVTPQETRFYQETWSDTPDSIQELAVVETQLLIDLRGVIENETGLERAVMWWLETLARHPEISFPRTGKFAWVEEHLLPAMEGVEAMVSGPR